MTNPQQVESLKIIAILFTSGIGIVLFALASRSIVRRAVDDLRNWFEMHKPIEHAQPKPKGKRSK